MPVFEVLYASKMSTALDKPQIQQNACICIGNELCSGCDKGGKWRPDGRRSLLLDDRHHGNPTERWW